jgi:hypothetical protein
MSADRLGGPGPRGRAGRLDVERLLAETRAKHDSPQLPRRNRGEGCPLPSISAKGKPRRAGWTEPLWSSLRDSSVSGIFEPPK